MQMAMAELVAVVGTVEAVLTPMVLVMMIEEVEVVLVLSGLVLMLLIVID